MKHYCSRGKTVYEVYEILKRMYGDNAFVHSRVYWWHDAFLEEGRTSAKLKGGLGMMEVLVNTAAIIMQEDLQLTECELAHILR